MYGSVRDESRVASSGCTPRTHVRAKSFRGDHLAHLHFVDAARLGTRDVAVRPSRAVSDAVRDRTKRRDCVALVGIRRLFTAVASYVFEQGTYAGALALPWLAFTLVLLGY